MDALYDNLENYNEVNIVDELIAENKELKHRVKEYAAAMETLQLYILQEFDKLTTEYKKLEINYSSLLKTAKAEIERKTTIITKLNIDKDTLVLNAMQANKNIPKSNYLRERFRGIGKVGDKRNSKRPEDGDIHKAKSTYIGRKNDRLPSEETVSSHNNEKLCIVNNRELIDMKTYTDSISDTKENVKAFSHVHQDDQNNVIKPKPQNIKNRRKSMPVLGKQFDKFSSDEEFFTVNLLPSKETTSRFCEEEAARKFLEKDYCDRTNKPLESSRENCRRSRYSRNYDNDRYKSRYDKSQKRRQNSSERYRRDPRDYSDGPNRSDYGRHRGGIESPPPEKYYSERIRNQDRRNYERDHPPDYEQQRYHQTERYPGKYKIHKDYNEPYSKKARTDYTHNVGEECLNRIPAEFKTNHNVLHDIQESCQSPDYSDNAFCVQPIKEIMSTAEIQLEDPRVSSNKYTTNTEDNSRIILSTVIGRNVDLKLVNKSQGEWDTCPKLPKALMQPIHLQEELISDLYKDIDNPTASFSPDPEEIVDFDMDKPAALSDIADYKYNDHLKNSGKLSKENSVIGVEIASNVNIPLNSNYEVTSNVKKLDTKSLPDSLVDSFVSLEKNDKITNNYSIDSKVIQNSCNIKNDNLGDENTKSHKKMANKCNGQSYKSKLTICKRKLVEDDLELSDETSDNTTFQKCVLKEQDDANIGRNTANETEISNNMTHCEQDDNKDKVCNKDVDKILDVDFEENIKQSPSMMLKTPKEVTSFLEDIKQLNLDKKDKIKKKTQKPKGKSSKESSKGNQRASNAKLEPKKEIEPKQEEIKTKFSELFGDTNSSLITPEDLGIMSQVRPSDYVPLSEDAQDSVDVKAKCLEKVQTRLAKAKAEDATANIIDTDKSSNEKAVPKANKVCRVNSENKKKKSKKKEEPERIKDNMIVSVGNNNDEEPQDFINAPYVVRTEIISLGVQSNDKSDAGVSIIDTDKNSNEKAVSKNNKVTKVNSENKKNKTKKKEEPESIKDRIIVSIGNENNPEPKDVINAPYVVRTEISSGVQSNETNHKEISNANENCNPELYVDHVVQKAPFHSESRLHHEVQEASFHPEPYLHHEVQKPLFLQPLSISALATSTPAKKLLVDNHESVKDDNRLSNIQDNTASATNLLDESSNNNTMDSQTETDVPDVRIVVKRRRKVLRRPVKT